MSYKKDLQANNTELRGILTTVNEGGTRSAFPLEISTESEMNEILANATASSVGSIYKFTGTGNTYEYGSLYIIQKGT